MRALKWVAGRILRLLPEALRGRVLPGAFAYDASQLPTVPVSSPADVRLLVAPVNYAGQGWEWAAALRAHSPGAWAMNMVVRTPNDFGHPADLVVPLGVYAASVRWQRAAFASVADGFTHVMIEAEKQPFGALLDETTVAQARRLREHGIAVVMLCHGTDVRSPSRHREAEPESPFRDTMAGQAPRLERIARDNRRTLDRIGAPVLVSTPGLLADVPGARWLPVVVDVARWSTPRSMWAGELPVVAHAPSSSAVKGSEAVDPVLQKLEAEGLIRYHRLSGVPFAEMPEAYQAADIVVDQLRLGDYGVAACEAMAAGRVVVGHVSPAVRTLVRERTGFDLPVVEADRASLEGVIRGLVADRENATVAAGRGSEFVRVVHDGRLAAEVLRSALDVAAA